MPAQQIHNIQLARGCNCVLMQICQRLVFNEGGGDALFRRRALECTRKQTDRIWISTRVMRYLTSQPGSKLITPQ